MAAFLKKYWPLMALIVAIGAILYLMGALDRANDEVIAGLVADKTMAKHRADREKIIAKYAPLNAALTAEAVTLQQGSRVLAAKVVAKQRELVLKDGTLAQTRAKLEECSAFLGSISYEYNEQLVKADKLRLEQIAVRDAEITEWRAKDERSINTIGQMTKRIVMLTLNKRKRLIVGPQVGYGFGGPYVGAGVTVELFRFKVPGQS
jgi:hypothetical protein